MLFNSRSYPALGLFLWVLAGCAPSARADRSDAAWVQLTASGAEARASAASGQCPIAHIDGAPSTMVLRQAAGDRFPAICRLPLPATAHSVDVDGQALPLPVKAPQTIVFLGDSGCRIQGATIQSCNDSRAWPFARVAALAAAQKPDLVVHVGDYYYREQPCPPANAACAGSPYGDQWDTWRAEFFNPAAPLLKAAPWVFVRGNHEICGRGGLGWFTLLDAGDAPLACPATSAPFAVDLGGLSLYILDSAATIDRAAPPHAVAAFARQLDALGSRLDAGPGWIVTHRPVWGLVPVARIGPIGPLMVDLNATEQAAVRGRALAGVQMVVSGHVHDFDALTFGPGRPAQLIVGTGGDTGERADTAKVRTGDYDIDGMTARYFTFDRFGYLLMQRDGTDWTGAFHDADDQVIAVCRLHDRALRCAPKTALPTG